MEQDAIQELLTWMRERRQVDQAVAALTRHPTDFVYYVDLYGDAIKIGFSAKLRHGQFQSVAARLTTCSLWNRVAAR